MLNVVWPGESGTYSIIQFDSEKGIPYMRFHSERYGNPADIIEAFCKETGTDISVEDW